MGNIKTKTYTGNRSLDEIKAKVENWDQSRFDNGGDWINFIYEASDGLLYPVIYNGFNGTFLVKVEGEIITERNTELDNTSWYSELLDILYTSK